MTADARVTCSMTVQNRSISSRVVYTLGDPQVGEVVVDDGPGEDLEVEVGERLGTSTITGMPRRRVIATIDG
jgi:hypothetical protein